MKENLKNKKIIVAGSEGLLGNVIANYFEENGNDVVRLDLILGHDLTNEKTVKKIMSDNQSANVLITPFALNPQLDEDSYDLFDLPLESVDQYLKVNLLALFSVCREFARVCPANSSIINFSSTYGILSPNHSIYPDGFTKHIGYSISKSGVIGLTQYLSTYLAPKIRVNVLVPGGVENNQSTEFIKQYSDMTPMKRMMKKQEVMGLVKYLVSDDSMYTTGSVLKVDGGWTSW